MLEGKAQKERLTAALTRVVEARHSYPYGLTEREQDVLLLIVDGWSTNGIMAILNIGLKMARLHTRNIMGKLDIGFETDRHPRVSLVLKWQEHLRGRRVR